MEEEIYYPFKKKIILGRIVYSILLIALGYLLIAKQESLNWLTIYGWFVLASGIIYLGLLLKNFFARRPGLYLNSAELFSFFCLPKRKK